MISLENKIKPRRPGPWSARSTPQRATALLSDAAAWSVHWGRLSTQTARRLAGISAGFPRFQRFFGNGRAAVGAAADQMTQHADQHLIATAKLFELDVHGCTLASHEFPCLGARPDPPLKRRNEEHNSWLLAPSTEPPNGAISRASARRRLWSVRRNFVELAWIKSVGTPLGFLYSI
jgi:hypothetical protein